MSDCWCWNDPGRTDDRDAELARLRDRLAAVERGLADARAANADLARDNNRMRVDFAALTRAKAEAEERVEALKREAVRLTDLYELELARAVKAEGEAWNNLLAQRDAESALAASRAEAATLWVALERIATCDLGSATARAALAAAPDAAATLALVRALGSALERMTAMAHAILGGQPVRDATETFAEATDALRALAARFGSA